MRREKYKHSSMRMNKYAKFQDLKKELKKVFLTRIPVLVASLTACNRGLYWGLNVTVNAESMIRPFICVPKSILQTSSYWSTVLSPAFGV